MSQRRKHSLEVRLRQFSIWQKAGYNPWPKPKETAVVKKNKKGGDFYKGAFNNIPFLNDDAKRTFKHLLLRPGYMIRDYIQGEHERYLAPLTALIVFYAFFALVSAVLQPVQHRSDLPFVNESDVAADSLDLVLGNIHFSSGDGSTANRMTQNMVKIVKQGYLYLHLDEYPELVKTHRQSSLAALEGTLRSQGIPLFLMEFFFLWLAMSMALRRYKLGMSAYAAASAYVLCQFSFFMLFAVLLTWGKSSSIGLVLMFALLIVDYHQWLDISWKKGFKLALRTGIYYGLIYGLLVLMASALVLVLAYLKL